MEKEKEGNIMPYKGPEQSYQNIRNYAEKWRWRDPKSKIITTGYLPPANATEVSQVPVFIKYITLKGKLESGNVVTLKVDVRRHQRMVMFVESKEVRIINDYLVISIDGTRFITH